MNIINKLPKVARMTIVVLLVIALVTGLVITTILVLNIVGSQKNKTDETSTINSLKRDAAKAQDEGNTDAAIDQYKKLLSKYEASGDTDATADAQAKIKQLNGIKDAQKKEDEQTAVDAAQRAKDAGVPNIKAGSPN